MKTFKSLYVFAVATMLLLAAMPAIFASPPPSVPPPDDVAMWIQPVTINLDTSTVGLGYKFNVTVWGKSNVYVASWQFWLRYNAAILNATGCWYCLPNGMGDPDGPSEFMQGIGKTTPVAPVIWTYNGYGQVEFTESWSGGTYATPKPNGARMAIVEFMVTAVPGKGQTLESLLEISFSTVGTWIMDKDDNYYYTAYDASYSLTWAPPPSPGLEVLPATRFYDRYAVRNGTLFTETVTLTGLSAAWYLTNVSFTLNYNPNELEITNIVGNNAAWDSALNIDTTTPGQVGVYAETSQSLSGTVDIITLTFMIIDQGLYPLVENHVLSLTNTKAFDHTLQIPVTTKSATITVEGYLAVAMPWMEVKPKDTVMGSEHGECVKGQTFQVEVTINRLHFAWRLVCVEFRLSYNKSLLKVVNVEEGPYLQAYAPHKTYFIVYLEDDGYYGRPHILVGDIILPNGTGYWEPPFPGDEKGGPNENGTVAIITFQVIHQSLKYPAQILDQCALDLFGIGMYNDDAENIPVDLDRVVNGTYKCWSGSQQGRFIDVYGGADNAGYGSIPFPAPYGGQGLNQPMDLVIPQSEVTLFANVTYNFWPVQSKDVGFEVEGPFDHVNGQYMPRNNKFVLLKETARTDSNGVATISFAMPWYCEDPESLLGVWKVTAAVNIRDQVVMDTLYFYYDYMVHIWKVTTDKEYYAHCETVEITVEYGSHAMQEYPGLFSAIIKDELNVVIGMDLAQVTLGGARFCTFANNTVKLYIHIEKWAFVGYADIYVNCYDKDPTEGGFAWTPQAFVDNAIYIEPR